MPLHPALGAVVCDLHESPARFDVMARQAFPMAAILVETIPSGCYGRSVGSHAGVATHTSVPPRDWWRRGTRVPSPARSPPIWAPSISPHDRLTFRPIHRS